MDAPVRLEAMLDRAEAQIAGMVAANPRAPGLLARINRIRDGFEDYAGPYVAHVHKRFNAILASLGLLPTDDREPFPPTLMPGALVSNYARHIRPRHDRRAL